LNILQILVAVLMTAAAVMMFVGWRRQQKPLLGITAAVFAIAAVIFWTVAFVRP
jgi:hypothetical protein